MEEEEEKGSEEKEGGVGQLHDISIKRSWQ